jgi:hypothetical protein
MRGRRREKVRIMEGQRTRVMTAIKVTSRCRDDGEEERQKKSARERIGKQGTCMTSDAVLLERERKRYW